MFVYSLVESLVLLTFVVFFEKIVSWTQLGEELLFEISSSV